MHMCPKYGGQDNLLLLAFLRIFLDVKRLERYKSFDEMKSKESTGTMSSPEEKKIAEFFRLLRQSTKTEMSGD
jgi:hypothetical protein